MNINYIEKPQMKSKWFLQERWTECQMADCGEITLPAYPTLLDFKYFLCRNQTTVFKNQIWDMNGAFSKDENTFSIYSKENVEYIFTRIK